MSNWPFFIFPIGLAFFLKKVEAEEEDVIKEYLSESNGEELLSLLETGYERKSNEVGTCVSVSDSLCSLLSNSWR